MVITGHLIAKGVVRVDDEGQIVPVERARRLPLWPLLLILLLVSVFLGFTIGTIAVELFQ